MDKPNVFLRTNETKLWWVFCHSPRFDLGPFPSEGLANSVKIALEGMFETGTQEVQDAIKEALGL